MSEMVERCVKAVEECAWDWREQASEEKIARAVIAAMRDPTTDMLEACGNHAVGRIIWRQMIDEALK